MNPKTTLLEVLNDAADCLQIEGWTNHDYEDRNGGDGEDIITAITKKSRKWDKHEMNYRIDQALQEDAMRYCVEALACRIGNEAFTETYLLLIESKYPGAALVHWQTNDCADKWDAIALIEEAADILLSLV